MPDPQITIRLTEEMQVKFKKLSESGCFKNYGELLSHLINYYTAQVTILQVPILRDAVSAVNELTGRVSNILVGAGESLLICQEKYRADSENQKQADADKITLLNMDIENLRKQYDDLKSECVSLKKRLEENDEDIVALNAVIGNKTALNNVYMAQIENQESQINDLTNQLLGFGSIHGELIEMRRKAEGYRQTIEKQILDNERALIQLEKQLGHEAGEEQARLRREACEEQARLRNEIKQILQKADEGQVSLKKEQERERHASLKAEYETRFIALVENCSHRK